MNDKAPVLKDKVLTFNMLYAALRCLRLFIMEYMHIQGDVSWEQHMARRLGKIFETVRASTTDEDIVNAITKGLSKDPRSNQPYDAYERDYLEERLERLLRRAEEVDTMFDDKNEKRESLLAPQYYIPLRRGWRFAAKPDEVQMVFDLNNVLRMVRVIDEKIGGRLQPKTRENMFWFGWAVAKALKAKMMEIERAEASEGTGGKRSGRQPRNRHPFVRRRPKPAAPALGVPLTMDVRLMGLRRNELGELEDAHQPPSLAHLERLEEDYENTANRVTKIIEEAFANNHFPAKVNDSCDKCPFKKGCPAWPELQTDADVQVHEMETIRAAHSADDLIARLQKQDDPDADPVANQVAELRYLSPDHIEAGQVLQLIKYEGGPPGIRDEGAFLSAVHNAANGYFQTKYESAAAYLRDFAVHHPFINGNKRIALESALVFLYINGTQVNATAAELTEAVYRTLGTSRAETLENKIDDPDRKPRYELWELAEFFLEYSDEVPCTTGDTDAAVAEARIWMHARFGAAFEELAK